MNDLFRPKQEFSLKPLRPKQARAIEMLRETLASGLKRPVIQAPTGFGKTVLAANIVSGVLSKNRRVAFCVPMLSLIDQTFERFRENGIDPADMGVIQGDHEWRRSHAPVQICSVQTLAHRGYPAVDIVVVDEAHVRFRAISEWIKREPDKIFVALTATPWARGMADDWQKLIVASTLRETIADGHLTPFRVLAPSTPDLSGIKIVAGDYHEGQLSERMSGAKITADIVSTWLEKAGNLPTLVFAVDRAHARVLHEQFRSVGVVAEYVDANTDRAERNAMAGRFQRRETTVIVNIGTMTTGVDLDVRCVVFARPTKSEILFVQCLGRGARLGEAKSECLVLDHAGTTLDLGLPTDIHHAELRSGKQAEKSTPQEAKIREPWGCSCGCLVSPTESKCPACGNEPKRKCTVHVVDGELREIGAPRPVAGDKKANRDLSWEEKAQWLGGMRRICADRGYAEGWAANKYREKFGVWPNDPRVRSSPPCEPLPALQAWIRSRQIRFAKGSEKARNASKADMEALAAVRFSMGGPSNAV